MKKLTVFLLLITSSVLSQNLPHNPFTPAGNSKPIMLYLHYAKAADVAALLTAKNSNFISKNGYVVVEKRINALWVEAEQTQVAKIKEFVSKIDVSLKQVAIVAKIVSVDSDYVKELGVKLGTVENNNIQDKKGLNIDTPTTSLSQGKFTFSIAKLNSDVLLAAELKALESEGRGKIISQPKLITLDHKSALIESGEDIPYQEKTAQGNTSVAFKKAVLGLKVTPEVISTKKILLDIAVSQDQVSALTINGVPAIEMREIHTQVVANNGETIVLGGIYEQSQDQVTTRVPVLGSIPIFGLLFRTKKKKVARKELLIFLTPRVL